MISPMNDLERFHACMNYEPVDHTPFWSWGGWPETVVVIYIIALHYSCFFIPLVSPKALKQLEILCTQPITENEYFSNSEGE